MRAAAAIFTISLAGSIVWAQAGKQETDAERAQKLYEEAYVIMDANPDEAVRRLDSALKLAPKGHLYYCKALRLKAEILGKPRPDCDVESDEFPPEAKSISADEQVNKLYQEGLKLAREKKYEKAEASFNQALRLEPENCEIMLKLGKVQALMGLVESASLHYDMFLETCPEHKLAPEIRKLLGTMKVQEEVEQEEPDSPPSE